jgi:DNA-binding CsgD family transcriptional regulator
MTTAPSPPLLDPIDATARVIALDAAFQASLGLLRQALEQLPFSVLLVDDQRSVVYANGRAQRRLRQGDRIAEVRGRLQACGAEREAFEAAWEELCACADAVARRFHLQGPEPGAPLCIDAGRILAAQPGAEGSRLWMLRLADATLSRAALSADWRARFGLTPAECKVGLALLEHGDAMSVAAALNIAGNTARAHLKSMFAKSGVRSQAALVLRLTLDARLAD